MKEKKRKIPGIVPLGNGEWRARVRYGPRKQEQSLYYRGSLNDCRMWQAEIKRRVERELPVMAPIEGLEWPPANKPAATEIRETRTTLFQLADDFRKHPDLYGSKAKGTKTEIDYSFRIFLDWCDRNEIRYVDEIRTEGERFYSWYVDHCGEKEHALLHTIKRVKQLFKFALSKRRKDSAYCNLEFNPLEDCNPRQPVLKDIRFLKKEDEHPRLREHMTVAELDEFGSAEYRRGIWEILYYCGMRPGELCHLRWPQVSDDFVKIVSVKEAEAKREGLREWNPKVRKTRETQNRIELHPKAKIWFEYFRELHRRKEFCIGLRTGSFSPQPLNDEVVREIIECITREDRPLLAAELYQMLLDKNVLSPLKAASPVRLFAIRLALSDTKGLLARKGFERRYGLKQHFSGGAQIMVPPERTIISLPYIRKAGPYVIGGQKPINVHNLWDWYDALADETMAAHPELDLSDTSPKVFRSSIGSHMLQHGKSIEYVSRFLRHNDVRVTQRHYAALLNDDIRMGFADVP